MNVIYEPDWDALDEETKYYTMMDLDRRSEKNDRNKEGREEENTTE